MAAKTHRVTVYGVPGYGPTVKEAKEDAGKTIAKAFADNGSYMPVMLRFPLGEVGMIYRTLEDWQYSYMEPDESRTSGYCQAGYASKREAEAGLRRHLAQHAIFRTDDNGASILAPWDEEGQRTHAAYVGWQQRMRAAMATGMTAEQARAAIG